MQGTVVMLLALSGLGCHHKKCNTSYAETCYSSCYSSGCYSSCYSGSSCYSSCYSSGYSGSSCYSSCYSGGYSMGETCYSSGYSSCYTGYSSPRHRHGLFGCKRKSCAACCAPAPAPVVATCDPCSSYGGPAVYGTYTPTYEGYSSGQMMGTSQSYSTPISSQVPMIRPNDAAPVSPEVPPATAPAVTPANPGTTTPPTTPPPAA